jgi:hypothetical protein
MLRGLNWLRFTVADFYEYGNEIWSSVKVGIISPTAKESALYIKSSSMELGIQTGCVCVWHMCVHIRDKMVFHVVTRRKRQEKQNSLEEIFVSAS